MKSQVLDDFASVSDWTAVTSGQARLDISREPGPDGQAMRLEFDFGDGGGFVVARKPFSLSLPEAYAFTLRLRGAAPPNKFEFKLVDPSGHNVWRYQQEAFDFACDWRPLKIRGSQIDFAWGPAGSGTAQQVGAIEVVIAAPPGGKGSVWLADLRLEDHSVSETPLLRASSSLAGHDAGCAMDGYAQTCWRPEPADTSPWLLVDFREEREFGGLAVSWEPEAQPFEVQTSADGSDWRTVHRAPQAQGRRSYIYLPQCTARFVRLNLQPGATGIADIAVKPYDFSRSIDAFFHHLAREGRRGLYPRYLHGEQSYWTPAGVPHGLTRAVLNEEGLLEADEGSFSLEPFLYLNNELVTWADAQPELQLEQGYLPIPSSVWRLRGLTLATTAFATGELDDAVLYVRYRLENTGAESRQARFFAAIRPFQVTPPWQSFGKIGGASPIRKLACERSVAWIDGNKAVIPLSQPSAFGAAAFEQGHITDYLQAGRLPGQTQAEDGFGYASGAWRYDLELPPGNRRDIYLAIPFGACDAARIEQCRNARGEQQFAAAVREWEDKLATVELRLPEAAQAGYLAFKTAAAHILANRRGAALQPGPRRYIRSWIRDGASMAAALLRMGCTAEAADYARWYAPHIADDGRVPCCVDRDGPDRLAEYDSQGQFIHAVLDCFRFSGDKAFLRELWPAVKRALAYLEALRRRRLTAEFQRADKRACYGLLPESVSHEGYLAQPVHAYWDDFWALRGLEDAAAMAELLDEATEAARLVELAEDFRKTLAASIQATMAQRGIDFLPGSVEWADFDPAATANAVSVLDRPPLPPAAVARTFDRYMDNFRRRRRGEIQWTNYTPYEIRVIDALVRLGRRGEAHELLAFFLADRRPLAWNQWPEIAWRDARTPAHLGDVPHSWIGAEYVLAFRGLFAYELDSRQTLVIAAGIPGEWLAGGFEIAVRDLPTGYGKLSYTLRQEGPDRLRFRLSGDLAAAPGRFLLKPPLPRPVARVAVNGKPVASSGRDSVSVAFTGLPLEIAIEF